MLLILLTVSLLGETVLNRFAAAMQRTFNEDFESVAACQDMSRAIDRIDTSLQQHFWRGAAINAEELDRWRDFFDSAHCAQRQTATLPGEKEATDRLAALWDQLSRAAIPLLLDSPGPLEQARQNAYAQHRIAQGDGGAVGGA